MNESKFKTLTHYNLQYYDDLMTAGDYELPIIKGTYHVPDNLIGFNYMLSTTKYDNGVHFYLDDYQFERIWNVPERYVERLKKFDCVLSPDFSLYVDMPMAMKIWNVYRSRLIGQIMERNGIQVIPTVSWAEKETFKFCFDGLPENKVLSVSTVGVQRDKIARNLWQYGMDELIDRLHPQTLLIYGNPIQYTYPDELKVCYFNNTNTKRFE